jgi:hypothetical protein
MSEYFFYGLHKKGQRKKSPLSRGEQRGGEVGY